MNRRTGKLALVWTLAGIGCATGGAVAVSDRGTRSRRVMSVPVPHAPAPPASPPACMAWDADGDRIPDRADDCPVDPETYDGYEDDDGCYDKTTLLWDRWPSPPTLSFRPIYHDPRGAAWAPPRADAIGHAVKVLKARPDATLVEVQGHLDPAAAGDTPVALSEARAQAVFDALVAAGIDAGRLRVAGYGARCPVHPEPRSHLNDRVTLKLVEHEGQRLGITLTCPAARDLIPRDRWTCQREAGGRWSD